MNMGTEKRDYYSLNISGFRTYLMEISWCYDVPISHYIRSIIICKKDNYDVAEYLYNTRYDKPRRKRSSYPEEKRVFKYGRDYIQIDLTNLRQFLNEECHSKNMPISTYIRELIQADMIIQMNSSRFRVTNNHWKNIKNSWSKNSSILNQDRYLFKLDITGLKEDLECNAWVNGTSIQNYIHLLITNSKYKNLDSDHRNNLTSLITNDEFDGQLIFNFKMKHDYIYIDLLEYKDFLHSLDVPITTYIRQLIQTDTALLEKNTDYSYAREIYKVWIRK